MEVINFPSAEDVTVLNGQTVKTPTTGVDYLFLCKRFLTIDDYEEVLLAIMDEDYYREAEDQIKRIVDSYFDFP